MDVPLCYIFTRLLSRHQFDNGRFWLLAYLWANTSPFFLWKLSCTTSATKSNSWNLHNRNQCDGKLTSVRTIYYNIEFVGLNSTFPFVSWFLSRKSDGFLHGFILLKHYWYHSVNVQCTIFMFFPKWPVYSLFIYLFNLVNLRKTFMLD